MSKSCKGYSFGDVLAATAAGFAAGWVIKSMRPAAQTGVLPAGALPHRAPITGGADRGSSRPVPGMSIRLPATPRDMVDRLYSETRQPINPFAAAVAASGHQINWAATPNPLAHAAEILGQRASNIVSPSTMPLLYAGFPSATVQRSIQRIRPRDLHTSLRPDTETDSVEGRWLRALGITCAQWGSLAEKTSYYARARRAMLSTLWFGPDDGKAYFRSSPQAGLGRAHYDLLVAQNRSRQAVRASGSDAVSGTASSRSTTLPRQRVGGIPKMTAAKMNLPGSPPDLLENQQGMLWMIDQHCGVATRVPGTPAEILAAARLDPMQWHNMSGPDRVQAAMRVAGMYTRTDVTNTALWLLSSLDMQYGQLCTQMMLEPGHANRFDGVVVQYAPLSNGDILINDVNQGMYPDCYFCAALGGVAWTQPGTISSQLTPNANGELAITLYSDMLDPSPARSRERRSITVTNRSNCLWIQPPLSYFPLGTHGRDARVSWATAFETAKAGWELRASRVDGCQTLGAGGLNPGLRNLRNAAAQISGGTPTYWSQLGGSDVWENLRRISDINGKILHPFVASVLPEFLLGAAMAIANVRVDDIVAFHVYTVLGHMERNGRRYVVLRNPWGHQPMKGPEVLSGYGWNTLFLGNDGVFGLSFEAFVAIFDGGLIYGAI